MQNNYFHRIPLTTSEGHTLSAQAMVKISHYKTNEISDVVNPY